MKFDSQGRELPDGTPVEIPLRFREVETTDARIRRLISTAMSDFAAANGDETLDEANDFDIEGDDPDDVFTEHEVMAMQLERPDGYGDDASYDAGHRARIAADRAARAGRKGERRDDEAAGDRQERAAGGDEGGGADDDKGGAAAAKGAADPGRGASPRR